MEDENFIDTLTPEQRQQNLQQQLAAKTQELEELKAQQQKDSNTK